MDEPVTVPTRDGAGGLLAVAKFCTGMPVVGKHLEWVGPVAAIGMWGWRQVPQAVGVQVRRRVAIGAGRRRQSQRRSTASVVDKVIPQVGEPAGGVVPPESRRLPPLLTSALNRWHHVVAASVPYGDDPALVLDVWRATSPGDHPAPVLVFVPGGGWIHGSRAFQGYALLSHLVERGWVCVSIDYRVAPHHPWPQHIDDVSAAIDWTHRTIGEFGGDPDFITIAGCSAGGHLAALAALTRTDADASASPAARVRAAVGLYGRYDWQDRSTEERRRFMHFLESVVVGRREAAAPEVFRSASPIALVDDNAPPFFVVHGTSDAVIPVAQARHFVKTLHERSSSAVRYLELPGAGHAFDIFDGARTDHVVAAVGRFLQEQWDHRDDGPTG